MNHHHFVCRLLYANFWDIVCCIYSKPHDPDALTDSSDESDCGNDSNHIHDHHKQPRKNAYEKQPNNKSNSDK